MHSLKEQFLGFYNTLSLFDSSIWELNQFEFEKIDIDNLDFESFEITGQMPLGKRVERFFEFYIENSNRYDVIKQNIQIISNKNTLGEIDFILEDKKLNTLIHLELVYKYYLYTPSLEKELARYIGPNRDDTLIKKLKKLKDKQFPLLYKNQTKEYLDSLDIENIEQKMCLKANIFLPKQMYKQELPLIDNSCIKGFYISYEEFLSSDEYKEFSYFMPHRYDWLIDAKQNDTWKSYDEILEEVRYFMDLKKSPLLWLKNKSSYENFFVTWY